MVLSILVIAAATVAVLSGWSAPIDDRVVAWFADTVDSGWQGIALNVTVLGNTIVVFAIAAVASALLWMEGRRRESRFLIVSLPVTAVTVWAAKHIVGRPRPDAASIVPFADSPAYPSGHAAMAAALATAMSIVIYRMRPGRRITTIAVTSVAVLFALAISATRLVLGVHYLTDVISGLVLGLLVASASALAVGVGRSTPLQAAVIPTRPEKTDSNRIRKEQ